MSASNSKTVLVVEDDPKSRRLVADLLEVNGYRVVTAPDGKQGVDLAIAEPPDLIIMDLNMPVMDGYEATRLLKAHRATRDIAVLAFTSSVLPPHRSDAFGAGCNDHLSKPIDVLEFLATVARYTGLDEPDTHPENGDG